MAQILSGSALAGKGTLITEAFTATAATPANNSVLITNTGNLNYVTFETEDPTNELFSSGSNLCVGNMGVSAAEGTKAKGTAKPLSGTADNSIFSWVLGNNEFRFHVTSTSPLPSDNVEYTSKDFRGKIYNFYATWSATAATLARNLADKINSVDADGLDEALALFTNNGFFSMQTTIPTAKYNGVIIRKNGAFLDTFSSTTVGKNPYPKAGGTEVNGHNLISFQGTPIPFVAEKNHLSVIVPNTSDFQDGAMQFQFRALTGTVPANSIRVKAAGAYDSIDVNIDGG